MPDLSWVRRLPALFGLVLLTACAKGGSPDPVVLRPLPPPTATPTLAPVQLPRDDAPHPDLTEWWYYTGHLRSAAGATYGYELVTFQGNRAGTPPAYAAHFAVTDNSRKSFQFAERTSVGVQPQPAVGFQLDLNGWRMAGGGGQDQLSAQMQNYGVDLRLSSSKPAVLHQGNGIISFGPAGDSYYYSRTRLRTSGTIHDHGRDIPVSGTSWMDHQWGNFISAGGGWDWFSIQLDDDSELMLFLLRDSTGKAAGSYGTLVLPNGTAKVLDTGEYAAEAAGAWKSPASGITYPSGWKVTAGDISLQLEPTVLDQELRTTSSTGVIYWEGDVSVHGTKGGQPLSGVGYVELVGYH